MQSLIRRASYGCVRVFWLDRSAAKDCVVRAARRLGCRDTNITRIVLFGSLANGTAMPASDADLLIIVENSQLPFIERAAEYRPCFSEIPIGTDLFVYAEDEVAGGHISLVNTALRTGMEVYRRDSVGYSSMKPRTSRSSR